MKEIARLVADYYDIPYQQLFRISRKTKLVTARQMIFYIATEKYRFSLMETGRFFEMNHATVFHGVKRIKDMIDTEYRLSRDYLKISEELKVIPGINNRIKKCKPVPFNLFFNTVPCVK